MWKARTPARRATIVAAIVLLPLTLAVGCTKDKSEQPLLVINDYITGVQVDGQSATLTTSADQLPAGSADGPAITVPAAATAVNGGSLLEPITASKQFAKVRLALQAVTRAPVPTVSPLDGYRPPTPQPVPVADPAKGYLEVTLTQAANKANLVVSVAQALPGTTFVFHFALVDAGGGQGAVARQVIDAIPVGTGEIQVSVSWDVDSDVDIHVEDPTGDEVYWRDDSIASGGVLDLDSNADCDIDHVRNENITWDKAPAGKYIVRIDYFEGCGVPETHYVVTVRVIGQPVRTFSGTLTGKGDVGGKGDGTELYTFQIAKPSAT